VLNHRGKGWIAAFALIAAALVLAPAALAAGLNVELAPTSNKAVLGPNDGVLLRFIVTNDTGETLAVLHGQMPFRGLEAELFNVELNGHPVTYTGKMVARLAPGPDDWLQIGPGQSVSTVVNLSRVYDMSQPGTYTVQFSYPLQVREADGSTRFVKVESDPLLVASAGVQQGQFEGQGGPPVSEGCTPEQFAIIAIAEATAGIWAGDSDSYMDGIPLVDRPSNAHYDTWFGLYDAGRWATVNTNFEAIDDALDQNIEYICTSCGRTTVAYVYPAIPWEIYICPTFFDTRLIDADYQAGVVLHEVSHWDIVANTNDYAYGETNCMALADSNPDSAVLNADSYHMFAKYLP